MKQIASLAWVAAMAAFVHLTVTSSPGAPSPPTLASPANYVAHEWGTFTSVQAADGQQLEWNPLAVSELPGFVYDLTRSRPGEPASKLRLLSAKTAFRTLQRMETPVIYFYHTENQPLTLDAEVKFPQGVTTEWYPQVRPLPAPKPDRALALRSVLQWDRVEILPTSERPALPGDASGSHYYAARGADANHVRVRTSDGANEIEKFLFYRGVGHFRAPLTVTASEDGRVVQLRNDGAETLRHFFVFQLRDGAGSFQTLDALEPGATNTLRLHGSNRFIGREQLAERIGSLLRHALEKEGLYAAEAQAMVKTWADSWFAEPGLRVFYLLPGAWTDRALPLKLNPSPKQVVRVMVGRAELIPPQAEWSLLRELLRFCEGGDAERTAAVANVQRLGLGRFAEPALSRLLGVLPKHAPMSARSWELLEAVARLDAVAAPATLAQK
jgi:hypothetical protein